ncbi:MAG: hypothetical protein BRD50_06355 [Bacteroidetes bacterium SW_11_45_7]|nr:MAG: hypothetical protein BRD50_06355 [Bacteroidetes bacterium SW_11_45_7]
MTNQGPARCKATKSWFCIRFGPYLKFLPILLFIPYLCVNIFLNKEGRLSGELLYFYAFEKPVN